MTYTDCSKASQFRVAINENFVWDYLRKHNVPHYHDLNVGRLAEQLEDAMNLVDILVSPSINVDIILRKLIGQAYK